MLRGPHKRINVKICGMCDCLEMMLCNNQATAGVWVTVEGASVSNEYFMIKGIGFSSEHLFIHRICVNESTSLEVKAKMNNSLISQIPCEYSITNIHVDERHAAKSSVSYQLTRTAHMCSILLFQHLLRALIFLNILLILCEYTKKKIGASVVDAAASCSKSYGRHGGFDMFAQLYRWDPRSF